MAKRAPKPPAKVVATKVVAPCLYWALVRSDVSIPMIFTSIRAAIAAAQPGEFLSHVFVGPPYAVHPIIQRAARKNSRDAAKRRGTRSG